MGSTFLLQPCAIHHLLMSSSCAVCRRLTNHHGPYPADGSHIRLYRAPDSPVRKFAPVPNNCKVVRLKLHETSTRVILLLDNHMYLYSSYISLGQVARADVTEAAQQTAAAAAAGAHSAEAATAMEHAGKRHARNPSAQHVNGGAAVQYPSAPSVQGVTPMASTDAPEAWQHSAGAAAADGGETLMQHAHKRVHTTAESTAISTATPRRLRNASRLKHVPKHTHQPVATEMTADADKAEAGTLQPHTWAGNTLHGNDHAHEASISNEYGAGSSSQGAGSSGDDAMQDAEVATSGVVAEDRVGCSNAVQAVADDDHGSIAGMDMDGASNDGHQGAYYYGQSSGLMDLSHQGNDHGASSFYAMHLPSDTDEQATTANWLSRTDASMTQHAAGFPSASGAADAAGEGGSLYAAGALYPRGFVDTRPSSTFDLGPPPPPPSCLPMPSFALLRTARPPPGQHGPHASHSSHMNPNGAWNHRSVLRARSPGPAAAANSNGPAAMNVAGSRMLSR